MNINDKIKEDLDLIARVFEKHKVRLFLVYGALLGMYRDGDLLPEDDDIDFCVIDPISYRTRKDIGHELFSLGFEPQQIGFNVFGRIESIELGYNGYKDTGIIVCQRNIKFTIFFFKKEDCDIHKEEYVCTPKYGGYKLISIPTRFFKEHDKIKLGGQKFLTPYPIPEFLAHSYEDWKNKTKRDHSPLHNELHPDYNKWVLDDINDAS